ncbi:hypothetical protein OJ997_03450 [Solirubrobacter phytolaccae]|uniref:Uncharacterized protein n=1 Tax=Solirubrobacter phytolaccae TaxID=1404360 RepID=A0A9X3N4H6_9ACTN|nr:hypothetical protein [Solirubrobacter phytolaccae]MDA0179341.1 hypothetical protein [Solirubrobacter phytolaccae]
MLSVLNASASDNEDRSERIRDFVSLGGKVVGAVAGSAIGLLGGPEAALAGGAAGTTVGEVLASAGVEFFDRRLAERQGVRAAAALAVATVEIDRRLAEGERPRPDFADYPAEDSDASQVLEGTLMTAANSYEQRKVPYMGRFFANLAFDETVSVSLANLILKLLDRLTYGQFRVLATLASENYLEMLIQLGAERREGTFSSNDDVVAEMDELSSIGLIGVGQTDGQVVPLTAVIEGSSWRTMDLYRARLTPLGVRVHRLLGLAAMPDYERDAVVASLRGQA